MSIIFRAYPIIRKALFSMNPEAAHEFSLSALNCLQSYSIFQKLFPIKENIEPCFLMGLNLKNPVGLAAGFDKNALHIDALGNLGFGFIEVGTVTPQPQPGNTKRPRIFRLEKDEAIINQLGFNNNGLKALISNILQSKWRSSGGILGINIGKNSSTSIEDSVYDYLECLTQVYPYGDYVTVNISSPNTSGLRDLQVGNQLITLLKSLQERREQLVNIYEKEVPLAIKISPNLTVEQIDFLVDVLLTYRINGVVATNTSLLSRDLQEKFGPTGGLSGAPIHELSLSVINRIKEKSGNNIDIIGSGGILSGKQASEKMRSGSTAVQIYTGLIYRGPILIDECIKAIKELKLPIRRIHEIGSPSV